MTKIKIIFFTCIAAFGILLSTAQAHNLFVSDRMSSTHLPGHANVVVGWGHAMPMDDFYRGDKIDSYAVYDPFSKKMDFGFNRKANYGSDSSDAKSAGRKDYGRLYTQRITSVGKFISAMTL